MKQKTSVAAGLEFTRIRDEYDAACKRLLSEKIILAHILKGCVTEFRDFDPDFIAETCIESPPKVSEVPVAPDETGAALRGMNTAQTSPTEGSVYFDIYFSAVVPGSGEVVQLIINVEAQDQFYPGYPLTKRGIYYGARMLSAQKNNVFANSQYGNLQKVYSIWICTNPPKKRENAITCYEIRERGIVGDDHEPVENYDLLTLVRVYLGSEKSERYKGILKLLGTLLTAKATVEEKKKVLEDEFAIPMTREINQEVSDMDGSIFESVVARLQREAREDGHESATLSAIRNLMESTKWTPEQAMTALRISEADRAGLLSKL